MLCFPVLVHLTVPLSWFTSLTIVPSLPPCIHTDLPVAAMAWYIRVEGPVVVILVHCLVCMSSLKKDSETWPSGVVPPSIHTVSLSVAAILCLCLALGLPIAHPFTAGHCCQDLVLAAPAPQPSLASATSATAATPMRRQ